MNTETTTLTATRTWSRQQLDIFEWFENGQNNLVVVALAGTGKTTTIIEGIGHASETSILLCAFNKRIADELTTRISNPNAQAKTLHAVGFSIVKRYSPTVRLEKKDEVSRKDRLTHRVCPTAPDAIKKLVSRLHTLGREIAPHATVLGDLTDIALHFECEPDESWQSDGYDVSFVETAALKAMEIAANEYDVIDFSDMIFLPVRNHWLHKQYDLVVVDEAQDMTIAQLEIAEGVCRGRICIVGDPWQAIYGFRGADSGSIERLKDKLDADELGLTTTYRCGKAIVELAKTLVPDFAAGENNSDGSIEYLTGDKLTETAALSDFILSRVNAPLVSVAMSLLRAGKRTRIAGRDVGAGLKSLLRKLKARSIPELLSKLAAWERRESDRMEKAGKLDRAEAIHDQADMIVSLSDNARNVGDIEDRIEALFTDDGLGQKGVITCSSVHRAKGLEANRVFILADTLKDHNQEEKNICYVAITRAIDVLVFVSTK